MAKAAKSTGRNSQMVLAARTAGRLTESNKTLIQVMDKMVNLRKLLLKMREAAGFMYDDMRSDVQVREVERKAINAAYSAFKSAKEIIAGNSDDRMLYDEAMEAIVDNYSKKMGAIENFMDVSRGFIEGVDLKNLSYEQDAFARLEAFELELTKEPILLSEKLGGSIDLSMVNNPIATTEKGEPINVITKFGKKS